MAAVVVRNQDPPERGGAGSSQSASVCAWWGPAGFIPRPRDRREVLGELIATSHPGPPACVAYTSLPEDRSNRTKGRGGKGRNSLVQAVQSRRVYPVFSQVEHYKILISNSYLKPDLKISLITDLKYVTEIF